MVNLLMNRFLPMYRLANRDETDILLMNRLLPMHRITPLREGL